MSTAVNTIMGLGSQTKPCGPKTKGEVLDPPVGLILLLGGSPSCHVRPNSVVPFKP